MGSWEEKERRARDGERGSGVEEHAGTCGSPQGPGRMDVPHSAERKATRERPNEARGG